MIKSLYNGLTGLKSYQTGMDVIANNIANVNTTAYKSSSARFSDLLYQTMDEAGIANANTGTSSRNPKQVGLGSKVSSIQKNITTPGAVEMTEYPWDMRIQGETFFVVHDGTQNYYTKDGTFGVDVNRDLVTRTGGLYVSGWMSQDGKSVDRSRELEKIHLPSEADPDEPTYLYIEGNIDGRDEKLGTTGDLVSIKATGADGKPYEFVFSFTDNDDSGRSLQLNLQRVVDTNGTSIDIPQNPSITVSYDEEGNFVDANGSADGRVTLNLPEEIAGANGFILDVANTTLVAREEKPVSFSGGLPDWIAMDEKSMNNGYMSSTYKTKDGVEHSSSVFDFSKFSADNKASLIDNGFYFTCCTCENYYSIKFVSGTENSVAQDGSYYIYSVGIDDVTSGKELVKKIVDVTNGNPNKHYTQLAANGSKLVIYDEREYPEYAGNPYYGLVGKGVANYDHKSESETSLTSIYGDSMGPTGKLLNYRTETNGMIYATYEGGERLVAQIAAAKFQNPSGLSSTGQNLFKESLNSGNVEYMDVTEDDLGSIHAGELEMSNVQLSEEFAQMIIMQRAYQSNSKVISTSDQMIETLRDLKR